MFRILSFCGGGVRGYLSVYLYNELLETCPSLLENTDMLAGTSVGAPIISTLLSQADKKLTPESFKTSSKLAFGFPGTDPDKPAFSEPLMIAEQRALWGTKTLGSLDTHKVLLTSFCTSNPQGWAPVLFNNIDGKYDDVPIADAVTASSTMPGMCAPIKVYKGPLPGFHVDGAFAHHDPTIMAIAMAVSSGVALEEIVVIDFGTGFMKNYVDANHLDARTKDNLTKWGAAQWSAGNDEIDVSLLTNGQPNTIFSMMLNGTSTSMMPDLAAMFLQDRFAYLNPVLDHYLSETNVSDAAFDAMKEAAEDLDLTAAKALVQKYWCD